MSLLPKFACAKCSDRFDQMKHDKLDKLDYNEILHSTTFKFSFYLGDKRWQKFGKWTQSRTPLSKTGHASIYKISHASICKIFYFCASWTFLFYNETLCDFFFRPPGLGGEKWNKRITCIKDTEKLPDPVVESAKFFSKIISSHVKKNLPVPI